MQQKRLYRLCVVLLITAMTASAFAVPPSMLRQSSDDEVRGVWVATVSNLYWPSRPGLSVEQQKAEIVKILDKSKEIGFNMVVLQVRPTGDATYKSDYFPWARCLTGTQGKDPGYDPLEFWVEESHKRGMDLHAWVNPYRLTTGGGGDTPDLSVFSDDHPAHKHPDWVIAYADKKMYFDPGTPECRKYIVDAALEIVKKYDVDGIHMDDYFYPYPVATPFPDDKSFAAFGGNMERNAWRRQNVNLMIKEIHDGIQAIKPDVQFGISPFGIWRNKSSDPAGSDTNGGVQSYDSLHADTKFWVENGDIDYITPQLYWNIGYQVADYEKLLKWWDNLVARNPKVRMYVGQAGHRVGGQAGTPWEGSDEIVRQIKMNRATPAVSGQILFGWPSIANNRGGVADQLKTLFTPKTAEASPHFFKEGSVSVYLSPSLQPANIGFGKYGTEENRMHEIADMIEPILVKHGVTVWQNKIGMSLRDALADSNEKNPSIHVAIHTNAFNRELRTARGVLTIRKEEGPKLDECDRLARRLYEALCSIYDGPRRGVVVRQDLYEPKTSVAAATLIEIAFHDNEVDSKWVLNNMQLIGETLATGILLHLAEEHPDALKK